MDRVDPSIDEENHVTAATPPPTDGFTLIGRHPVLANAPLIAIISGIAAAVFGSITGAILGGMLDIDFGPAITIPLWFIAIAGTCLLYLGVTYRRVGVDAARGIASIDGETVSLRSITNGTLLTRSPAATVPVLSLRLTTDSGTSARIIINGGWLRHLPPHDFIPLTALIAGSSIPDDTGEDPLAVGKERMSRALAGKSTDLAITRRGFLIDCISGAEQSGDPELLASVIAASGPIGRSILDEAARIEREQQGARPAASEVQPGGTLDIEPIVPPAPQFGTVGDGVEPEAFDAAGRDDDRFRRPDDPARVAAMGAVDRGHLDKLGERGDALGERDQALGERDHGFGERGEALGERDGAPGERDSHLDKLGERSASAPEERHELPAWVQPKDRARMLAWLDDDEDVVHLQPIPETAGARTLRRVCDWILVGFIAVGFLVIIIAAVAEKVIDSLLPSDANSLIAVGVVGAALLAFVTWLIGGFARASEIRIAQRFSLDWLEQRGPEQLRRGLPPVLLQHFLGPVPGARLLTAGAYSFSVLGGIGLIGGALLTVDPDDLEPAIGPVMLAIGIALTLGGIALFLVRARSAKRQRELAVELGGERLAFLGSL